MSGIIRRATLIDEAYKTVAQVPVVAESWPAVIKYGTRYFGYYAQARPATIEAAKAAEVDETYREITVYDATV